MLVVTNFDDYHHYLKNDLDEREKLAKSILYFKCQLN